MDLTSALGSIKAATDIARLLKDSYSSLEQAETKLKFAELVGALADAKIEIAGIQEALLDKDREIKILKEQLEIKDQLEYHPPYYWLVKDGDSKDGPYCQKCFDDEGKLIRLQTRRTGSWFCNNCQNGYQDKNYAPETYPGRQF